MSFLMPLSNINKTLGVKSINRAWSIKVISTSIRSVHAKTQSTIKILMGAQKSFTYQMDPSALNQVVKCCIFILFKRDMKIFRFKV